MSEIKIPSCNFKSYVESDNESQTNMCYKDSNCDELCCYSDDKYKNSEVDYNESTTSNEEINKPSHSREDEVTNDLEDWMKFT